MAPDLTDSEDELYDSELSSGKIGSLIQQCRDFIPDSTRASLADIKSKLSKAVEMGASSKTRNLLSVKEKPKLEDSLRELSNDAAIFQKKIDAVLEAVVCMVDTVGSYNDNFSERLSKIESRLSKIKNSPKPSVVRLLAGRRGVLSPNHVSPVFFIF